MSPIPLSKAEEMLRQIERTSRREFLPIIGPEKGRILSDLVKKAKPKRILEVGTRVGHSAIVMARELGNDTDLVTIENDEDSAEIARENIRAAKLEPNIRVLIGDALDIIPELKGKFDFIFLDAAKDEYVYYLRLIEDKLEKGAIIVADNAGILAEAMKDYLSYVRNSGKYESRFVKVNRDGIEVSMRL